MNIILFGGMGAGKDTVANIMRAQGYIKHVKHLGAPIKQVASLLFSKPDRQAYQELGQGIRELFTCDVWNDILWRECQRDRLHLDGGMAIADGRQPNEVEFWRARGFIPVGIIADAQVRMKRLELRDGYTQDGRAAHETEKNGIAIAINCLYTIHNNGTMLALTKKVNQLVNQLRG